MPTLIQKDPTRTTMLRRKFMAEMKRRFAALKSKIWQLVAVDDCFGLSGPPSLLDSVLANSRFAFETDGKKIQKYREWFDEQVATDVISLAPGADVTQAWTSKFVFLAYRQGVSHGFTAGRPPSTQDSDLDEFSQNLFLDSMFNGPIGTKQMELLATRSFEQLNGITKSMSGDIARTLSDGFVQGHNPRKIARELVKNVEGLEKKRALVLARTEIVHAYSEASLDAMEALGLDEVSAMVEWLAGPTACPLCAPLMGVTLTIDQARGLIPRHPNCLCAWIPAPFREKGQRRGKRAQAAINRSLISQARQGESLKSIRIRTRWPGADLKILKKLRKG